MKLLEIYNAFEEIKREGSRNNKEHILWRYIEKPLFKEFLQIMYNPYIVTGLGKKSLDIRYDDEMISFVYIEKLFEYLKTHSTHRNQGLTIINNTLVKIAKNIESTTSLQFDEMYNFLVEVVTKTYSCGITAKTINKVFGYEFIPVHDIMLAKQYEVGKAYKLLKKYGSCYCTLKIDGVRATLVKNGSNIIWLSRSGKTYEGLEELNASAELLPDGIYDGEIVYNDKVGNMANHEIRRNTTSIMNSDGIKKGVKYVMFDTLTPGISEKPYSERRELLESICCDDENIELLEVLQEIWIDCVDEETFDDIIRGTFNEVREQNQEGIMINFNTPYEKKRTWNLMKVKDQFTLDLRVIDYFMGEGEFTGLLGGLVVEFPHQGQNWLVKVGSGFSIEQRKYFLVNIEHIIGSIIEVKATEVSQNQNGGYSLSYPRFVCLRDDKDEVSVD